MTKSLIGYVTYMVSNITHLDLKGLKLDGFISLQQYDKLDESDTRVTCPNGTCVFTFRSSLSRTLIIGRSNGHCQCINDWIKGSNVEIDRM
jgi:hypothetical protein